MDERAGLRCVIAMDEHAAPRRWEARARALGDRRFREAEGACFVEGIRAVCEALDGGVEFEAVLTCGERLRSEVARAAVARLEASGVPRVDLPLSRYARLSDMENPVGLAAIVRWAPMPLQALPPPPPGSLHVIAEDLGDPGNLGTLLRTADGAGAAAVIVAGAGTDAAHRRCLRASLGTAFRIPVAHTADPADALAWAAAAGVRTVATSAHATRNVWNLEAPPDVPLAVLVGSEERGLRPETASACDEAVRIPMLGSATSLNVAVATGIILYDLRRRRPMPAQRD
jgi:TrmH family RNA methyltransferase